MSQAGSSTSSTNHAPTSAGSRLPCCSPWAWGNPAAAQEQDAQGTPTQLSPEALKINPLWVEEHRGRKCNAKENLDRCFPFLLGCLGLCLGHAEPWLLLPSFPAPRQ